MARTQSQAFRGGSVSAGSGIAAGDIRKLILSYYNEDGITPNQKEYDPLADSDTVIPISKLRIEDWTGSLLAIYNPLYNDITVRLPPDGLVRAYPEDTEPKTLIDKMEVVDNRLDPDDPLDTPLLQLLRTLDNQGNRRVAINEDHLHDCLENIYWGLNGIYDTLDQLDFDSVSRAYVHSSLNQSPGDNVSTGTLVDVFAVDGQLVGDCFEFEQTTTIGDVPFGYVWVEPGTYLVNANVTCQWVGHPAGTFLAKVGLVMGENFDFSYEQEIYRNQTKIVTFASTTKLTINITHDADTPVMGFWVKSLQVVKLAGGVSQTNIVHDSTLTGQGSAADPLGVTPAAFGKVKNIPTSVSQFRTGDVIPVDGPNGPAKMPASDLQDAILGGPIDAAVQAWLAAHPEATTTVQDNSITDSKLAPNLKFNRAYSGTNRGYIVLDKDLPFISQVTEPNTTYEIRWNFDLGGGLVTIPSGCVLFFVSGKLSNGTINGDYTQISSRGGTCFSGIAFNGTFEVERVESEWFGLIPDFDDATGIGTDNASSLSSAVQLADKSGASLHISAGSYGLDSPITMNDMKSVSIYGDGDKTILNQLSGGNRIFSTGSINYPDFFELKDVKLVGRHRYNATLGDNSNRLIGMYAKKARFIDVTMHYSRQMSLTCTSDYIDVVRCEVMYSARDSINVTASKNAYIEGCRVIHCADDAIAVHANTYMGTPLDVSIRVVNNLAVDTNGIVCLGAQNCVVNNNILKRVKGYGIRVGGPAGGINPTEGLNNPCNIVVSDNVIEDVFNLGSWTTGVNLCAGIWVDAPNPSGDTDLGANLGQFDYTNHIFVKPWENGGYYQNGGYYTGTHAITIKNNQILKTLLATISDSYESLLMGKTFKDNGGMGDLTFAYNNLWNGTGIMVQRGAYIDTCIESNRVEGYAYAIQYINIPNDTSACQVIKNNVFRNCFTGVSTDAASAKTNGILLFDGNMFDLDPYLRNSDRNSDGSWKNDTYNAGICYLSSRFTMNVIFKHNVFRNIKSVGTGTYAVATQGNTFFLEFKNTTQWYGPHKGCGSIIDRDSQIVFECSDPTSANYLSKLGVRGSLKATAQPTANYYMAGDVVMNVGNDNTTLCWKRLTNGNTHAPADWSAVTIPSP